MKIIQGREMRASFKSINKHQNIEKTWTIIHCFIQVLEELEMVKVYLLCLDFVKIT